MELYTIRSGTGTEVGPCTIEQVKDLIKEDKVHATTMVFLQSTQRWHLAASVAEVRELLKKYNPRQASQLRRIRALGNSPRDTGHAMMVGRISTARFRRPFWKRLFGG